MRGPPVKAATPASGGLPRLNVLFPTSQVSREAHRPRLRSTGLILDGDHHRASPATTRQGSHRASPHPRSAEPQTQQQGRSPCATRAGQPTRCGEICKGGCLAGGLGPGGAWPGKAAGLHPSQPQTDRQASLGTTPIPRVLRSLMPALPEQSSWMLLGTAPARRGGGLGAWPGASPPHPGPPRPANTAQLPSCRLKGETAC